MKDVTYGSFNCDYKPNMEEKWRTRLTAGGDRINYPFNCSTPTADMTLLKIIINSTISTKGAQCMMIDHSNFYLKTPIAWRKYMHLNIMDIPEEIITQYKPRDIAIADGYVYCEISKAIYGLPQSGIITQQLLEKCLTKVGYTQSKIIPGLWKHQTRPIIFCLVVYNFCHKYTRKEDIHHLLDTLQKEYKVTEDWRGQKYLGLTIEWDYDNRKAHLWMPGYIKKALLHFKHEKPEKIQNSPHPHTIPNHGSLIQYAADKDNSPKLDKDDTKYIQQVVGMLL